MPTVNVQDVFRFDSGMTVIAGLSDDEHVGPLPAEASVLVDGQPEGSVRLTAQRMPGPATARDPKLVALETQNELTWESALVEAGRITLKW